MGHLGSFRDLLSLAVILTIMIAGGCSDHSCEPRICGPQPTLDNIWPNDDQRFWEYQYTVRSWSYNLCETCYQSHEEVPPPPSLDDIVDLLANHPIGARVHSQTGIYRMRFDGDSTNPAGVTAQALRDTAYFSGLAIPKKDCLGTRDFPLRGVIPRGPGLSDTLVESRSPGQPYVPYPTLIHGGVWEKNTEWIGTYCLNVFPVDTLLCWKFLEADLAPGSQFSFEQIQYIPENPIGDLIIESMHCRVLRQVDIEVGGRMYANALECVYRVDYGLAKVCCTATCSSIGWCRPYDYGVVIYAPTVGPVYSYERMSVEAGNDESTGAGDRTLILTDTGVRPEGNSP